MIEQKQAPAGTEANINNSNNDTKLINQQTAFADGANFGKRREHQQAKSIQPHKEVLLNLLQQVHLVNFRDYLKLPDDEKIAQKYIVVAVVMHLLETAKARKWNLCKAFDYVYVYNGAYWLQMEKEDLKQFLGSYATKLGYRDCDARHYEFKDKLLKQFLTDAHLPQPQPDPDKILINLKNGTLELIASGWNLRQFDANDFLTYQLGFDYNPVAICPMFDKYLVRVLPDESSRYLLQDFSGYIFSKQNLEKMLLLTGGGANGKSVFFNVLMALLGKHNVLTYSLGLFAHEYNRAKLTNVLLNYSSEKGTDLNPDTFKALVSGEPQQAREPYGKSFTLYNTVRFIINSNELPRETEQTEAYYRRWLIIPFDVTIPKEERDGDLADKIIDSELSGVMNWLLAGLHRITANKRFTECERANSVMDEFKRQSDSVALFVSESGYIKSENNKTALADLYTSYKNFCSDDGYKPVGKNKFSFRLEGKGFEKTRLSNGSAAFLMDKSG